MSKEYSFSKEVKKEVIERAKSIGVKPNSVHHYCARSIAKKYNLPQDKIVSPDNAIALEQDFHDAIHCGGRFFDKIANEWVEIDAFDEDDFIFLAQAILGLTDEYFDESKKAKIGVRKNKRKRRR